MSITSEYTDETEEEDFRDDMRVFLRLRPINKLEQSRRSKNCIELHEDPTLVTVDSPLEGEYDYTFDHVFEEIASQQEVYEEAVASVPQSLLEGYNCTVIAYGQTGTGKTHTMLGAPGSRVAGPTTRNNSMLMNGNKSLSEIQSFNNLLSGGGGDTATNGDQDTREAGNNNTYNHKNKSHTNSLGGSKGYLSFQENNNPPFISDDFDHESEGMIPRTISDLFHLMRKESKATTEFTIRVSYVEIYLEKILDLIHPQGGTKNVITIADAEPSELQQQQADRAGGHNSSSSLLKKLYDDPTSSVCLLHGAAELCCLDEMDVIHLLARGNASRTRSATEMNTDSSRSHAIFIVRLEQHDRITNITKTSVLQMVDLAGSELASKDANKRSSIAAMGANMSSVQKEAMMINKSLSALNKMIRAQLAHQQGEPNIPLDSIARQSKLTRLLKPSFGGNCLTTLLLTASPSSYNIGETISTINFGQRCRRIYNDPEIIEQESPSVYKKELLKAKTNYEDAMALARALASECLRMRNGTSLQQHGPLWDTIEHLGRLDAPPIDFKVTIHKEKRKKDKKSQQYDDDDDEDDSDSENEEEINIYSNERVQFEDEIECLKEENEYLHRQSQDVEGTLAELQSEVAVLRSQNENLTVDKKRNVEELMNAKNEVQVLSQRKLEVEHNLRTSQFRENEAIVFLRQFRRFYRNVLKDKAAHGAGSIGAITGEVTDKVPNAPDLNGLRDVDCMLVESGLLEEYEVNDDKSSGSYLPSKEALLRSAVGAKRAAQVEAEILQQHDDTMSIGDDSKATYIAQTITRVAGPLRLPGPGIPMDTVTELAQSSVSFKHDLEERTVYDNSEDDDDDDPQQNDADAGAGSSPPMDDQTVLTAETGTIAHSIGRSPATGPYVTRRQRVLKTPAGRLTIMRENDLEKELLEMSERCIDLQMALNEEKAVVDALTNKSGGLSKKRLAQEAITLRQALEKKTASLTAIAWKMNELNLINKTYNEKMANREQHVLYLEEQLVELQNYNRRLIMDRGENDKKLRDELDNMERVVGAMSVPLWQFGETNLDEKPLSARIVITTNGSNSGLVDDRGKRRISIGAEEAEMEFPDIPDVLFEEYDEEDLLHPTMEMRGIDVDTSAIIDEISQTSSLAPEEAPKRPKRRAADKLRVSVNKLKAARLVARALSSESSTVSETRNEGFGVQGVTVGTQTSEVQIYNANETLPIPAEVKRAPDVKKNEVQTQTDVREAMEIQTQTVEVQVFDAGLPMVLYQDPPEKFEVDVQTDEVQVYDFDTPMILYKEPPNTYEVNIQTDEVQIYDLETSLVLTKDLPEKWDVDVQTDEVQVYDLETPMILYREPPDMYEVNTQTEEVQVYDFDTSLVLNRDLPETFEAHVQTDEVQIYDLDTSLTLNRDIPEMFDADVQTERVQTFDADVQTEHVQTFNADVQTEHVQTFNADVQTEEVQIYDPDVSLIVTRDLPEKFEANVQTDEVQIYDLDTPMMLYREPPDMLEVDVQTEKVQIYDLDTSVVLTQELPEMLEVDMQTDDVLIYPFDTPLTLHKDLPEMSEADVQTDNVQIYDLGVPMIPDTKVEKDDVSVQTDDMEILVVAPKMESHDAEVQTDIVHEDSNLLLQSFQSTKQLQDKSSASALRAIGKANTRGATSLDHGQSYSTNCSHSTNDSDEDSRERANQILDAGIRRGNPKYKQNEGSEDNDDSLATDSLDDMDHSSKRSSTESSRSMDGSDQMTGSTFSKDESKEVGRGKADQSTNAVSNLHHLKEKQVDTASGHVLKGAGTSDGGHPDQLGHQNDSIPDLQSLPSNIDGLQSSSREGRGEESEPSRQDTDGLSRPLSRFLPAATTDGPKPRGASRFMPDDGGQNSTTSRRPGRRFLLGGTSPVPSRRGLAIADDLDVGRNSKDELEYDELGLRWGLSEDEIAADKAVLMTPRRESGNSIDSVEDTLLQDEVLSVHSENEEGYASEDGLERDLFDNHFDYLKRSSHGKEKQTVQNPLDQMDIESDEEKDAHVVPLQAYSENDDDFEKMMSETAAALATANDLAGANDDDNSDRGSTDEAEENDYEDNDANNSYESDDQSGGDGESEFRSAQVDARFAGYPNQSLFVGGKPNDYVVRRFTKKLGLTIKPAVMNEVRLNVDDEVGSLLSVASSKDREAPQRFNESPRAPRSPRQEQVEPNSATSAVSHLSSQHRDGSGRGSPGERKRTRKSRTSPVRESSRHRRSSRSVDGEDKGERRSHRSSRRVSEDDGEGNERRSHRSRRQLDGEGSERRRDRSSRRKPDGGEGEEDRRHRSSRRKPDSDEGDEHRRHRSSRHRNDGNDEERRHRSSRKKSDSENGDEERRHRSSRRKPDGEVSGDERRHRSSHRKTDDDGEGRRHRSSRRLKESGDDQRASDDRKHARKISRKPSSRH